MLMYPCCLDTRIPPLCDPRCSVTVTCFFFRLTENISRYLSDGMTVKAPFPDMRALLLNKVPQTKLLELELSVVVYDTL